MVVLPKQVLEPTLHTNEGQVYSLVGHAYKRRQAKCCFRLRKKNSKFLLNVSRTRLGSFTGVMTVGHFGLNKHLATIGRIFDLGCVLCGGRMKSVDHGFIPNGQQLGGYTINY